MLRIMINGEPVPVAEAKISVMDHGFLYGDNVYEVVKTRGGALFAAKPHLNRLRYSAEKTEIPIVWSDGFLLDELARMVSLVGSEEAYLRMVVTRGVGSMGINPESAADPCRIIYGKAFTPLAPELYRDGVSISALEPERDERGNIKSGVNLSNIRTIKEARKRGAHEALRLSETGMIAECATSNIFWVKDGKLYTPSVGAGILKGVTRQLVMYLAEEYRIPVVEGLFPLEDLHRAEEVFITSTTRDILPVSKVDAQEYMVGPTTKRLSEGFDTLANRDIRLY